MGDDLTLIDHGHIMGEAHGGRDVVADDNTGDIELNPDNYNAQSFLCGLCGFARHFNLPETLIDTG